MSGYAALKDAIKLAQKYQQTELYEQLLSVREELNDLREQNLSLKEENRLLREASEIRDSIVFRLGTHWITNDAMNDGKDTPICPRCWDVEGIAVRQTIRGFTSTRSGFTCNNCEKRTHVEQAHGKL